MKKEISSQLKEFFRDKPVHRAYLFGSVVHDEDKNGSDIDILVELDYKNGADYFAFFSMQQQLSKLMNRKVDLVSANGLSAYIKPIIDGEKELIYERQNF